MVDQALQERLEHLWEFLTLGRGDLLKLEALRALPEYREVILCTDFLCRVFSNRLAEIAEMGNLPRIVELRWSAVRLFLGAVADLNLSPEPLKSDVILFPAALPTQTVLLNCCASLEARVERNEPALANIYATDTEREKGKKSLLSLARWAYVQARECKNYYEESAEDAQNIVYLLGDFRTLGHERMTGAGPRALLDMLKLEKARRPARAGQPNYVEDVLARLEGENGLDKYYHHLFYVRMCLVHSEARPAMEQVAKGWKLAITTPAA